MAICSYMFGLILAFLSYLVFIKYSNTKVSFVKNPTKRYDYIIGAGTTGCVLAARLSENPDVKVLLVEAGDQMSFFTRIPLIATAAQQGPYDWAVRSAPQKYSSFGLWDQTQFIPRGKGLGGSGQINFLLHGFGFPEDFSRWSSQGFKSWTLKTMKPYFMKAFGTVHGEFSSDYCLGSDKCLHYKAPMKLKMIHHKDELMRLFKDASKLTRRPDTQFRKATAYVNDGKRFSTLDAYLRPALRRENLHVLLKTQAVSISFENRTASSLYILQNNRELNNIFVTKEIVLSAGAIKTPQLLVLSGIGPRKDIERLKLKVIKANNQIGKNLHDHMNLPLYVSVNKSISITLAKVFTIKTAWDYIWSSKGVLSFSPVAGIEFTNTSALILFSMGTASEKLLRELSNYKPQVFRDTFAFHNYSSKEGFMFLATCLHPRSRGSVKVTKQASSAAPVVNLNYLKDIWDVQCMIKAIRRAEELISSRPFQEVEARIHWPRPERCRTFWRYTREEQMGADEMKKQGCLEAEETPAHVLLNCAGVDKQRVAVWDSPTTLHEACADVKRLLHFWRDLGWLERNHHSSTSPPDEYLECILREVAVTGHHVGGSCAGGTVVDDQLRVIGVSKLRVVDASVLPSPVSLFPNSILVGMAERAAELILKQENYS